MTLYELTGQFLNLYEMADDPDMDEQAWFDTMEAIGGDIEAKADGYARIITQLTADAEALKGEEERLYARRKAIENSITNLKKNLQGAMELTGKTKFKTDLFSFNVQNNAPSVVLDEQYIENIPQEYLKYRDPDIDRTKIKEDLKAGKNLDGIAHLEQTRSLRIK